MKFVNHSSIKTIRDRIPNKMLSFIKVTNSNIRKRIIINFNSAKILQDCDIPLKSIEQNIDIFTYYTLLSIVAWKIPSSHQVWKQQMQFQYLKRTAGLIRTTMDVLVSFQRFQRYLKDAYINKSLRIFRMISMCLNKISQGTAKSLVSK